MNALVKKEIRLVLPSFIFAGVLALASLFGQSTPDNWLTGVADFMGGAFCPAMVVMLALTSFGGELSAGTFSMLLAQPIPRQRIWRIKVWLLSLAVAVIWLLWSAVMTVTAVNSSRAGSLTDWLEALALSFTCGAVIIAGGLWTVLLFRQVAAAFWFTILTPGVIAVVISGVWPEKYHAACEPTVIVALLIYCGWGYWFGRRLFFRAQDAAWTGGNIVWPELRGTAKAVTGAAARVWRPRAALFWKEVQLHQSQFIMAGALAILHLGVIAVRKWGDYRKNSDLEFVLEIFWGLWLVMPMLVGAAAVAEERRLGTLTGQLGLPVKRRTQLAIKAGMVLTLSVLFGVAMPWLMEGQRIFPGGQMLADGFHFENDPWEPARQIYVGIILGALSAWWPLLVLLGAAMGIGVISFYFSTLTRNTLQALAPAVLGVILFTMLIFGAAQPESFMDYPFWRGSLIYLIGGPVLAVTVATLSFWNCRGIDPGWRLWWRNGLIFLGALALASGATTMIYHRAWEKLTPLEPAHGAARFSRANPPELSERWNGIYVRLEDGRVSANSLSLNYRNPLGLLLGDLRVATQTGRHFYEGSNWVNIVRVSGREMAGIKRDGSLWISEQPGHRPRSNTDGWKWSKPSDFVRIGGDTNWSSAGLHDASSVLLVKTDGTLWRWGATNWDYRNKWPGLRSFMPRRLGTESNWAKVFLADDRLYLSKTDGSVWRTWLDQPDGQQTNTLEPDFTIQRATFLETGKWRSTTAEWSGVNVHLGIRDDGTFRIRADQRFNQRTLHYESLAVDIQLGSGSNWLAVAGRGENIVTLKDDGTLWRWNFHHDFRRGWDPGHDEREMQEVKPARLGTHTDWVAIASAVGGIVSLADDGSLWYWPLSSGDSYMSNTGLIRLFQDNRAESFQPLLDFSRKPQLIANILNDAD